jgi:hypothetical protein
MNVKYFNSMNSNEQDKKSFCQMKTKSVSQSTNNLESNINPKLHTNQKPFVEQALISRSKDYILVTKIKSKKLAKSRRKTFDY